MLAWILKTKAEKKSSSAVISPSLLWRGRGGVVMRRKSSRKGSTPKVVRAEPKNTGESFPWRTRSKSKAQEAPSSSSMSSMSWSRRVWPSMSARTGSSKSIWVAADFLALVLEEKWRISPLFLSYTPRNSLPEPMGQLTG